MPKSGFLFAFVLGLAGVVVVSACGDNGASSEFDAGTTATSEVNGGSSGSSGASGSSGSGFGSSGATGDGGADALSGDGGPEICDGIDNDGNGIIDDVDVGHDGVCDCLRIATLGVKGVWGEGDVFASWLAGKSDMGAVDLGAQTLTPALLAGFEVIVAEDLSKNNRAYSDAEVAALRDWVKGGGGFMTLIGYSDPTERTNVNALLASFGMSYNPTQILAKTGGSTVPITGWVTPHPLTDGITKIGVDNGYEVAGAGTTLATEQGFTLLKAQEFTKGHVAVWGDEWITYNTEWSAHPDYQVERFWLNSIKWLTPAKECQVPIPPTVVK